MGKYLFQKRLLLSSLLISLAQIICAQAVNVTGTVVDDLNQGIPGVTVLEEGTNNGTVTNIDGQFDLEVQSSQATLKVSFIGMETQVIPLNGRTQLDIQMREDVTALEEVVVIGYGKATKKEITGSVATIESKDFNKGVTSNPMELIQGKVPGLSITNTSGSDPNGGFQITLRGLNSLSGGKSPLIIVDGVIGSNALSMLNPNEIESIDVLKDGSAAAIYGTRATNGVILITTKRPKAGNVRFEVSTNVSTEVATEDNRYLTADEYRQTIADFYPDRTNLDAGTSTNWFDEVLETPVDKYVSISSTGGTENLSFRANLFFNDNQGIVRNTGARTITPSIIINQTGLNGKLNLDYRFAYTLISRQGSNQAVINQAVQRNPTEPVFDPEDEANGGYYTVLTATGYNNPIAMINERTADINHNFFSGDITASYEILDDLTFRVRTTYNNNQDFRGTYLTRFYPNLGTDGDATVSSGFSRNFLVEPDLEFDKEFGKHSLRVLGGYSFFENTYNFLSGNNYDFDLDDFSYNSLEAGYALPNGLASLNSGKNSNRLIAFYGRTMYNFDEKYLLSASVRYEGSSRFGANNKWGLFPAVSLGWRMHEEPFMAENTWINNLKLRAGYGVTGNQDIPNYQSIERLRVGSRQFYLNGEFVNTYQPANNPNPDLKWEVKRELNVGLDFGFFDNKISGSIDVYNRNISDLLWFYAVPVPPNVFETIYANVGEMENRGVEVQLNYTPFQTSNMLWTTSVNFARNTNEMISFSDASRGYELEDLRLSPAAGTWSQYVDEGQPVGNYVAPVFDGVDENGDPVYLDVNGDGNVNTDSEEDRRIVGNQYPDFELGWNNNLTYKSFDLSFFVRGVFGQSLLNYERIFNENWQPFLAGRNMLRSQLDNPEYTGIPQYDSRYVEDASFVKLDNVTLGYNTRLGASQFRIYLTGRNLFVITDYSGVDPERPIPDFNTNTEVSGGGNLNYYPFTRVFLLGMDVKF